MSTGKIYGWIEDGRAYLSRFPPSDERRPAKQYASKAEAEREAKLRRKPIEWDDGRSD